MNRTTSTQRNQQILILQTALLAVLLGACGGGLGSSFDGATLPDAQVDAATPVDAARDLHVIWQQDFAVACGDGPPCVAPKMCFGGQCIGPKTACQTLSDCPEHSLCVNGVCYENRGCTGDSDCENGKQCVAGRCADPTASCTENDDCQDGYLCAATICTPVPTCQTDTDCSSGYACVAGSCVSSGVCRHHWDCPQGDVCDRGGACIKLSDTPCTRMNNVNIGCSEGQVCFEPCPGCGGLCLTLPECYPPGSFLADYPDVVPPCPEGQVCVQGACLDRMTPWTCGSDGDCPPAQRCQSGKCLVACTSDAQCASGLLCNLGLCGPPAACAITSDCPDGELCNASGICRSRIDCLKDSDCAPGKHCTLQQCL